LNYDDNSANDKME